MTRFRALYVMVFEADSGQTFSRNKRHGILGSQADNGSRVDNDNRVDNGRKPFSCNTHRRFSDKVNFVHLFSYESQ